MQNNVIALGGRKPKGVIWMAIWYWRKKICIWWHILLKTPYFKEKLKDTKGEIRSRISRDTKGEIRSRISQKRENMLNTTIVHQPNICGTSQLYFIRNPPFRVHTSQLYFIRNPPFRVYTSQLYFIRNPPFRV